MELSREHWKQKKYLALAFAIPFFGMLFVMLVGKYEPFGDYSMLYSDMYHQYYPFFVEFRRAIRSGDGLLYTWSVGLGMDYLGLIAYYLASPLNLLSVLVPEQWTLEYFSLLVPIKLGLASVFFGIFLKEMFRKNDLSISLFGALYGLCAWALGFQWNIMWLDTFALLPLVALGTVALLGEKKFLLYTLTLFLSIFANYYIGLFTCIFVFLLFFVYQFCRWGGWKKFFLDLGRIAFFSVLAIGMTAILELPALAALQTTQSSVNQFPTGFRLNIAKSHDLKGLFDAMRQVAGNMGGALEPNFKEGLPNVYCGILSIALMFQYLMAKKIPLRDKICAVLLLAFFNVSFIIRQLDYIWHGFHFTNMIPYRFSFLYSFVVLYMAYRAWLLRDSIPVWQILLSASLSTGILACSNSLAETKTVTLAGMELDVPVYAVYNLVFLLLYIFSMLYGSVTGPKPQPDEEGNVDQTALDTWYADRAKQRRRGSGLLLGILSLELIANLICFGLYFPGTYAANYPKGTAYAASVIRYMKEREEHTPFFRAETTHAQTLNDGALNSYRGVTAFTSSANVKTTLFMEALGFSAKNTYNRYLFEEGSPVSNLFLGLKYMIDRDAKERASSVFEEVNRFGDISLLENKAYLPLGFLVEPELADLNFADWDRAFVFQNELFRQATGLEVQVWELIPSLSILTNGVILEDQNGFGYCRYSGAEANSNVIYSFTAQRDGFACIHLDLPKRNDYYVSVNGVDLYRETISLPQMIAVGDVKTGDVIDIRVLCDEDESSTMTIKAGIMDMNAFWQGYSQLRTSTWELSQFESTYISGIIHCDRDGLMYTSIPQNGSWVARVDGEVVETVLVGDCMAAVELTEGVHSVTFTYENRAFTLGRTVTLVCAAILAGLTYASRRKKPSNKGKGKFEE